MSPFASNKLLFAVCLYILHMSCLTVTAGSANCPIFLELGFCLTNLGGRWRFLTWLVMGL